MDDMDESNLVMVTFEVDADILAEAKKVLAVQGYTLEEALVSFFYWCANYSDEAVATIRSWMVEE